MDFFTVAVVNFRGLIRNFVLFVIEYWHITKSLASGFRRRVPLDSVR